MLLRLASAGAMPVKNQKGNGKPKAAKTKSGVDSVSQVVVTGSSAGGIEALSEFVKSLPEDLPAPLIIAQHLDPSVKSALPEIIAKNAKLPVRVVTDREPLRGGVIYVVPNNRNVKVTDHTVVVEKSSKGLQPSVDLLFSTAAEVFGEGVVAIVLSGMGSDGAVGARAVKKLGGTVMIQDPSTAMYPSMPQSLPPTSVDIVSKLEAMGPILHDLLSGGYMPAEPTERTLLRSLLTNIRENIGFDFSNYKTPTILRRLSRLMAATGCQSLSEYMDHLKVHPEEYQRLVSSFLIKVTEFFRDPELFRSLRESVMPQLISYASKNSKELRLWSAGCATGEEAYSLAILVAECLPERSEGLIVRIFATDLDENAISFARRGLYSADALKEVPEDMLKKYFVGVDGSYEVSKRIRSMTVFGQHDFAQRAPFPRIDLALCRNVLIYFTKELQQRALQFFAFSIRADGYLVLGKSETTTPLPNYFENIQPALKIYRRYGDRANMPLAEDKHAYPTVAQRQPIIGMAHPPVERQHRLNVSEQAGDVLMQSQLGVVVLDRHYDIQAINNAAREMLNIRSVAIGEDLVHLASSLPAQKLRSVIDAAFRMEQRGSVGQELAMADAEHPRYLQVFCYADKAGTAGVAVLLVADSSEKVVSQVQAATELRDQKTLVEQLQKHEKQMIEERDTLLRANKDLMDSNFTLRESVERLQLTVEESESSTEEIETLNEEMQATNEELETLNEELQATVEELNTTNDELEARTRELQTMVTTQEEQRVLGEQKRKELAAVVDGLDLAVAAIDVQGKSAFANEAFRKLRLGDPERMRFLKAGKELGLDRVLQSSHDNGDLTVVKEKKRFAVEVRKLATDGTPFGTLLVFRPA